MIAALLSLIVQASPPASGAAANALLPTTAASAVFEDSGSTNVGGYSIAVEPNGTAAISSDGKLTTGVVSRATTKWLFAHLASAGPLAQLPVEACMKSSSFGSTVRIVWHGQRSPDLSCGAGPAASELLRTFQSIKQQLHIQPALRAPQASPAP
jgi:hypothetical protein